ncbi:DoxX family membrane protein [Salipaludibacillus sp. HK11]|uniref:DoxX family membrane protein n=1 Tax=Salipaludibacillus sp. HK11 TaxID=3394320 RepID=UPI0039FB8A94
MKSFIIKFTLLLMGLLFVPTIIAHAHVKWFTEVEPERAPIEQIISPMFISLAIVTAGIIAVLPQIMPKIMAYKPFLKVEKRLAEFRPYTFPIIKYGAAIAIIIQILTGGLFAPELMAPSDIWAIAPWVAVVLLLIPHKIASRGAGVLLLLLFGITTWEYGLFHMLDYAFYLAVIFVLLFQSTKLQPWSFPVLYLATGLSLCWVAVEKLVYPTMATDVIINHGVPTFGFNPETFVILTAYIEFVVGYLLVVGLLNRLLALVLTLIFISTTMLFGMTEIIGHFMIHIILITFIIEGVSFYEPPINMHRSPWEKIVFIFLNFLFVLATILLIYYRFA